MVKGLSKKIGAKMWEKMLGNLFHFQVKKENQSELNKGGKKKAEKERKEREKEERNKVSG